MELDSLKPVFLRNALRLSARLLQLRFKFNLDPCPARRCALAIQALWSGNKRESKLQHAEGKWSQNAWHQQEPKRPQLPNHLLPLHPSTALPRMHCWKIAERADMQIHILPLHPCLWPNFIQLLFSKRSIATTTQSFRPFLKDSSFLLGPSGDGAHFLTSAPNILPPFRLTSWVTLQHWLKGKTGRPQFIEIHSSCR